MLRGLQARRKVGTAAAHLLRTAVTHRFAPAGKRAAKACQACTPHKSVLTTETRRSHPAPIARRSAKTMMEIHAQKNDSKPPARAGGGECGGGGGGCGCGCDGIGGEGEVRGGSDGAGDQCAPATHAAWLKLLVGADPSQG